TSGAEPRCWPGPGSAIRVAQGRSSLPPVFIFPGGWSTVRSMSVDSERRLATRVARPLAEAARERYDRATADLDPPLALVDEPAFDRNAADMTRRAAEHPIRVATKSLRCRYLIECALAPPGYRGVMCHTLAEALWLHAAGPHHH